MQVINIISGMAAVIDTDNIDTDQIISAEYLKTTHKKGLGKHLFSNWRYDAVGKDVENFALNQNANCKVLIAGDNFGCGSSREHAPWAIIDFGIQAIISSSIADIFRNNAIKNGLLPIVVDTKSHQFLLQQNAKNIVINLESQTICVGETTINFEIDSFARHCFLNGMDQLDFIINQESHITAFENQQVRYI